MPQSEESLRARIAAAIRLDGPMPVDRYMQLALADPAGGYWQRPATIGAAGDFVTAPEISQVFGELIGAWCAVAWGLLGAPDPLALIELGPGRGTLLQDVLRTFARAVPRLHRAARVHLVEASAPLRTAQAALLSPLCAAPPAWHATLADCPDLPALVLANEFLDALPIRQVQFTGGLWRERCVTLDAGGALAFGLGPEVAPPAGISSPPSEGDIAEVRPGEADVLRALAARQTPWLALFVDYGPADPGYGDTLQAMRLHAYVDPLADPGACDLTAHVRFADVARAAHALGLAVDGPLTQVEFLGALGHAARTSRLMAANPLKAAEIEAAAQRLIAPTGMGTLFKVLCVRSPGTPTPPPWG